MKTILSCPICRGALHKKERSYACEKNHSFDIARQGYVNLLCGKAATQHGDNALMISSRRRFLERGYYSPLADALSHAVAEYAKAGDTLLDIGCGEGYYTARSTAVLAPMGGSVYAFDISKDALKAAAARHAATLFVAGAYDMPVSDAAFDIVTLFFSPFCREEILRALKPNGIFIMAYPAERHLWGLKTVLYDTPYLNRPEDTAIEGFTLLKKQSISTEIVLCDKESIADLFAMTPYFYKTSATDKAKLAALSSLTTEIDFYLAIYQKNYSINP